jgi:uncharacterized membrane protein
MSEKSDEKVENGEEGIEVSNHFFIFLLLGFAVVIVGIVLVLLSSFLEGGSGSFGGVIFIGPIPIVFGAGPDATWLIAIGVAIAIVMIVVFVLMKRRI